MKNSLILKVTNDEYEFVLNIYDSTKEMAKELGIKEETARHRVCWKPKHKKTKYVRVWLNKEF